jgi:hypothetical protein
MREIINSQSWRDFNASIPKKIVLLSSGPTMVKRINLIAKALLERGLNVEILADLNSIERATKKDNPKVTNVYTLLPSGYKYSEKNHKPFKKRYHF